MAGCGGGEKSGPDSLESNQTSAEFLAAKIAEIGKIDFDNNETRKKVMALAIDGDKLEERGSVEDQLFYAPNQQTPYSGWAKWADENSPGIKDGQRLGSFKEGKKHGVHTKWYKNGQKLYQLAYKDGKWDGRSFWWHENGRKKGKAISQQ